MALAVQPVDLRHVVTECIEQLRNERWGPRVDIEVGALPACLGNVILHEQVGSNLLGIALTSTTKHKHARIDISAPQPASE